MTKLLKNTSYQHPLLFKGTKTKRLYPGIVAKDSSRSFSNKSEPQDSGYTIIEAIVAMVVVAVLMIAIGPVLAFSVATRVQARRVELATQAGKAYIDALKAGAIGTTSQGFPDKFAGADLQEAPAPTDPTTLYCIDLDGVAGCATNSNQDFYVQGAWKNQASGVTNPTTTGYELIVRVYRAASFASGVGPLTTQGPSQGQQSTVTSGLGNLNAPVVEMRTEIAATNTQNSSPYRSLCARLGVDPKNPVSCQ
ncbi:hormogonium polysaccharide secretion pseudopilin HpsB [Phormidium nigroviride]